MNVSVYSSVTCHCDGTTVLHINIDYMVYSMLKKLSVAIENGCAVWTEAVSLGKL